MSFSPEILLQTVAELAEQTGDPNRYVVAFSGGLDSTVLTHALATSRVGGNAPIVAVYVDHGLQRESANWDDHCREFAKSLDIEYAGLRVAVDLQSGLGLEAAARDARYGAFRDILEPGDWLLSAHHRDDQAETVLLNLMRGSGPAGLAGIRALRRFGAGWLVRPLLDVPRNHLQKYANKHALEWMVDPSNLDQQFDRNYLRHEVLPRLSARWPDAPNRIRHSAKLAGEASMLLRELARMDLEPIGDRLDCLPIRPIVALSSARQRNLLRHVVFELGLPMPGSKHLERVVTDLLQARNDAQPLVSWPGVEARRHGGRLYLMPSGELQTPPAEITRFDGAKVRLGGGLGKLVLRPGADQGLSDAVVERGLELRYRKGGEEIKPVGQSHTRKLKKLLQDEDVVPWMRNRLPLIYSNERLVAVADLWIADEAASAPGTAIEWINRPPLT